MRKNSTPDLTRPKSAESRDVRTHTRSKPTHKKTSSNVSQKQEHSDEALLEFLNAPTDREKAPEELKVCVVRIQFSCSVEPSWYVVSP